jgi:hypothetical protein
MSGKHSVQKTSKNSPSPSNAAGNFPSASMEYYASNFPHPEHLERYEVLFPGAAEIVFTEFRK